ncbi:glycoside hydrolase [Ginsengibacter hankyongi]|uniref:Glycoside hydrolase n=1 Tax=Ginsengibacter hankyongi TaxID=2607284 RepID=A0A5J5ICY0_9BACT|nr:glycoside hydrolase [Ginsengibacter hankyongi]KAA9035916.1 glycoside hydrolase [Ginsengibacter hankyongi]
MKRNLFNSMLVCCCFIFLMAVAANLNGRWKGVLTTPDGNNLDVSYNFKVSGDTLTGTAESPEGMVTIDSGRVEDNTFSFQVTVDGNAYPHKGKLYDDSCGIDIDFGSQWVHTTLLRDTAR